MPVGEESEKFSVRRPERKGRAVGTFELPGLEVGERLYPDEVAIFLAASAKRDRRTIGGDDRGPGIIPGEVKAGLRRRRKIRAQRSRRFALA
jgi:hypothetical protein